MALPATDNFNRGDGGLGANWTTVTGQNAPVISSNEVTTSSGDSAAYWNADSFNDDQYSQLEISAISVACGPIVRAASGAHSFYVFMHYFTSEFRIYKAVSGSYTQLGASYAIGASANDILKLTVSGTTLTPSINGADQATRSDSDLSSGSAGLRVSNTSDKVDDWEGGNVAGGTTVAPTTIPTTLAPTTLPTTAPPTTLAPTTIPTTLAPTTIPTTLAPTTLPTTAPPTTVAPTTIITTVAPTTSPYSFYETCFQEYTTGLQPSDWTERWHTTVAASDVQNDVGAIGGKKLRTVHSSSDRYYLSWDAPSGPDYQYDNDVEILAKVLTPTDNKWVVRLVIHGSGTDSNEDGYLLDLHVSTDEIEIAELSSGFAGVLATVSKTLDVDTWYWVRFRREASGSTLKGKVWAVGAAEPGAWDISTTDSSNTEGRIGIGSNIGDHYCDWFSVCLGGGTARGPEDVAGCTTIAPTTAITTLAPTTLPTTSAPTTVPTTLAPTTVPTTTAPTTTPTTTAPTTLPTTLAPTTVPTTIAPTTVPTTIAPTTVPTTLAPTTVPTTIAPTTLATTLAPTTTLTTAAPTTLIAPTLCTKPIDSIIFDPIELQSIITKEISFDGNLCG